jgi:hypothetical protein
MRYRVSVRLKNFGLHATWVEAESKEEALQSVAGAVAKFGLDYPENGPRVWTEDEFNEYRSTLAAMQVGEDE